MVMDASKSVGVLFLELRVVGVPRLNHQKFTESC